MREYKENSENKYLLQKKKEIAKEEMRERVREEMRENSARRGKTPKVSEKRITPKRSKSKGALVLPLSPPNIAKDLLKPAALKNQDANFQLF